eukprot:TRINITY_DN24091_c0_g1_i1.p2 TRINITY_DN24091_c0_g1~~TRINITY_DN24091_c0_g1_i1.p2  ORF type:complete len:429 (+),score=144.29 TRINITY_DN24091_c0_g1_i1:114-1289(+)
MEMLPAEGPPLGVADGAFRRSSHAYRGAGRGVLHAKAAAPLPGVPRRGVAHTRLVRAVLRCGGDDTMEVLPADPPAPETREAAPQTGPGRKSSRLRGLRTTAAEARPAASEAPPQSLGAGSPAAEPAALPPPRVQPMGMLQECIAAGSSEPLTNLKFLYLVKDNAPRLSRAPLLCRVFNTPAEKREKLLAHFRKALAVRKGVEALQEAAASDTAQLRQRCEGRIKAAGSQQPQAAFSAYMAMKPLQEHFAARFPRGLPSRAAREAAARRQLALCLKGASQWAGARGLERDWVRGRAARAIQRAERGRRGRRAARERRDERRAANLIQGYARRWIARRAAQRSRPCWAGELLAAAAEQRRRAGRAAAAARAAAAEVQETARRMRSRPPSATR